MPRPASAQIANGNFASNASSFIYYPGYSTGNPNPDNSGGTVNNALIDDWTSSHTSSTGVDTINGTYGNGTNAFDPPYTGNSNGNYSDSSVTQAISSFGFIQSANTLTQSGIHLSPGIYTLTLDIGQRFEFNPPTGVGATEGLVTVGNGAVLYAGGSLTYEGASGGSAFHQYAFTFTVPTFTTNAVVTLANLNPEGLDTTLDFTNLSLVETGYVPEPTTYALLGFGVLALFAFRHRPVFKAWQQRRV